MDEKRKLTGIKNRARSPDDRGGSRMDTYVSGSPVFDTRPSIRPTFLDTCSGVYLMSKC